MALEFKELEIKKEQWGENKGQYTGVISYRGDNANIQLKITDDQIKGIFAIVADRMIEVSKEAAEELTADIIEALPSPD